MLFSKSRTPQPAHVEPAPTAPAPLAEGTTFVAPELGDWYTPVIIGADVIGQAARSADTLAEVRSLLERLTLDPYVEYLQAFYAAGAERFGAAWGYADITTVLLAAGKLAKPRRYLEIGVRRGRSLAMVAAGSPACDVVGFDMWQENYAGIENPGPAFVSEELKRLGHTGSLEFVNGNSHQTVPAYFASHPDIFFDLITVDGDHSLEGAAQDLRDVIPHLSLGGILVFDDTVHPAHPGLADVWRDVVVRDGRFSTWEYDDVGYGVAVAIRKA